MHIICQKESSLHNLSMYGSNFFHYLWVCNIFCNSSFTTLACSMENIPVTQTYEQTPSHFCWTELNQYAEWDWASFGNGASQYWEEDIYYFAFLAFFFPLMCLMFMGVLQIIWLAMHHKCLKAWRSHTVICFPNSKNWLT